MDQEILELLYRSFDDELTEADQERLMHALEASEELRKEKAEISAMRGTVAKSNAASFDAGFADRVMQQIQPQKAAQTINGDDFFGSLQWAFRRIAIAGAVAAGLLLAANLYQAQEMSLDSALAMPELSLEDTWVLSDLAESDE